MCVCLCVHYAFRHFWTDLSQTHLEKRPWFSEGFKLIMVHLLALTLIMSFDLHNDIIDELPYS